MENLIQSLVSLGGFGYLNYYIYARMSNHDTGSDTDRRFFIGLMSSMNYLIYLVLMRILKDDMVKSLLGAIVFTLLITLLLPKIVNRFYKVLNWNRRRHQLPELVNTKVYHFFTGDVSRQRCFVFALSSKEVLSSGYLLVSNGRHEEKSVILQPFHDNDAERHLETIDELNDYLLDEKIEARIYLNFEKNLKIIYF